MKTDRMQYWRSKKKMLDAVAMKNKIQAKLYNETKQLGSQELIEFYRKRAKAGPFRKKGGLCAAKTKNILDIS